LPPPSLGARGFIVWYEIVGCPAPTPAAGAPGAANIVASATFDRLGGHVRLWMTLGMKSEGRHGTRKRSAAAASIQGYFDVFVPSNA